MWSCFGRRRPARKACSLLMNLMAMTGLGEVSGVAFLILYIEIVSSDIETSLHV